MNPIKAAGWVGGVFGKEKSFRANPILGNPRLNEMGLHRTRVAVAARMAAMRRRAMARRISAEDREAFDRDGFVMKPDFLPKEVFDRLRTELFDSQVPAREMRQGQTVTRMSPLVMENARTAHEVAVRRDIRNLMSYAAGRAGEPVICVQTVIADPTKTAESDPQTALHADTFHATAKMWLFLTDVGEEDGPFAYVPGSNKLTPERLDWEYRQSLHARADARLHHSLGSFRITEDELPALGYGKPRRMTVKANTLVIADTYGFHHRTPSPRHTIRVELYGYLRRNPFLPWNGLDVTGLPGIRGRQINLFYRFLDFQKARFGKESIWKDVGHTAANGPARI